MMLGRLPSGLPGARCGGPWSGFQDRAWGPRIWL